MKKPTNTKQQRYRQKMRAAGFSSTEVYAHDDDKPALREFARMLRNNRANNKAA